MEKVVFQTGAKSYQIVDPEGNELGVFRFTPTDAGIIQRYKEVADYFAGIGDRIKEEDLEETLPSLEKEAGEKIDLLFGAPVSESFFKITSPFTVLEDGQTFAEQIVTVIGDLMKKEIAKREDAVKERQRKYTAKYEKETATTNETK